jgi:thiamine-phosphate pyrophosphorylase
MINTLQYITQSNSEESILSEVKTVLEAGITWVQLRIKEESLDYLRIAKQVKILTDKAESVLIINDRVDIAIEIDADGVHVGLTDMPIQEVRTLIGTDKIIGGTANTVVDAKNAELFGADYIGLGPFKHTTTKKVLSPVLGIEGYKNSIPKTEPYGWQLATFNIPILAIGGLVIDDILALKKETGIHGVALSGLIYNSEDKPNLIKELKEILN